MKNLFKKISIVFFFFIGFSTTNTLLAQFCCCTGCGNMCISQGASANCGGACFVAPGCGSGIGAVSTIESDCAGTACNAPAPAELVYFKSRVTNAGVELMWETSSELDNDGFEILRGDGNTLDWIPLDFVLGNGTTDEVTTYTYLDRSPPPGDNYYRLKQIDYDGTFKFSEIEIATLKEEDKFNIWPTLANNLVYIRSEDHIHETNDALLVEVFNMMGQKVSTQRLTGDVTPIDISELANGQYFININVQNYTQSLRFVKTQ